MKKFICFISLLISILCGGIIASANDTVDVYINGEKLDTDQPAILFQDRTMVPLRAICESLHCDVGWDGETNTALIENEVTMVAVQIDNYNLTKKDRRDNNGEQRFIPIDVPPIIYNDRTLVPARAIAEAINAEVNWNGNQNRVDITLEYDFIDDYSDEIALVKKNEKYGYIDKSGNQITDIIYEHAYRFSDGLAEVTEKNIRKYIDTKGKVAFSLNEGYVGQSFSEGYAVISTHDSNYKPSIGLMDKTGKIVVPLQYNNQWGVYSEGAIAMSKNSKWGYIDCNNKVVVPFEYDSVYGSGFKNGCVPVKKNDKWGVINKLNKTIIPFDNNNVDEFDYGYVRMDGIRYIINSDGYEIDYNDVLEKSDVSLDFCGGIAPVIRNGKWGFIDENNNIVIPCIYDDIYHSWSDGFVGFIPVMKDDKWGIINSSGEMVVPFAFDGIMDFFADYVLAPYYGKTVEFSISDYLQSSQSFDEWISDFTTGDEIVQAMYSFQVIQGPTWVNEHYIWPNKPENTIYNCVGFTININTEKFINRTNEIMVCVKPKDEEWRVVQVETVEYTEGDYSLDVWFDEPVDLEEFCCYPNVAEQKNGNAPWNLGNAEAFYYLAN